MCLCLVGKLRLEDQNTKYTVPFKDVKTSWIKSSMALLKELLKPSLDNQLLRSLLFYEDLLAHKSMNSPKYHSSS